MTERVRLVLAALFVVLCGASAAFVRLTPDLARLVPNDGALAEAVAVARRFDLDDLLVVEIDGTGHDADELRAATDAVGEELEATGRFTKVRWRVDPKDGAKIASVARAHAVELVPADVIRERCTDGGLDAAFAGWTAQLSGPTGALAERAFGEDPLDLGSLALSRLKANPGPFKVRTAGARFVDETGDRALVFAWPADESTAIAPDTAVGAVDAATAKSPLPARWFGGRKVAAGTAATIQRDATIAGWLGTIGVFGLLLIGMRTLRPAIGLVPPMIVAAAAAAAMLALRSPVHGIVLGFAGSLLGLAEDYWTHLWTHAADTYAGPDRKLRLAAAEKALRHLLPGLALSAAGNIAAFGVLMWSRYPIVADFGAMGVAGILGAALGVILVGPTTYAWIGGKAVGSVGKWLPRWPALVVGALTLLAGFAGLWLGFEGDPRALATPGREVAALEKELGERYGGFGTGGAIATSAGALDEALDRADAIDAAVSELPGVSLAGTSAWLPGPAVRSERRAALPPRAELEPRLRAAADRAGFSPDMAAAGLDHLYATTEPLSPSSWSGTPIGEGLERQLRLEDGGAEVILSLVLTTGDADAVAATLEKVDPKAHLVIPTRLASEGVREIKSELLRLGGISGLLVLGLLIVRYRRVRPVIAAALPVLSAIAWIAGVAVLLGWKLDAVSASAMVLVLGLAVDYGVFMVEAAGETQGPSATAVLLSAATSIIGFVALLFVSTPALAGVGLVVSVGLSAACAVALLVTPIIARGSAR